MLVDVLEYFLDKEVKIFLHNNFLYRGKLLKISETFILIDDIKDGHISVNVQTIREVKLNKDD